MSVDYALAEGGGIIQTPLLRSERNKLSRAVLAGKLVRLYPGVLVAAHLADDPAVQARAALLWQPQGVLMARAAARVTFWPQCPVDKIDLSTAHIKNPPKGVRLHQRRIPVDLRRPWFAGQVTVTELTILDLAADDAWEPLCHALRSRAVSAASLARANDLLAHRPGVDKRAECLQRALGNPWSVPEMELQDLYRTAGIGGWVGNRPLYLEGRKVIPDITFEAVRVIVEVDGREFHAQAKSFEADHARHNALVAAGWVVLRFTPTQIRREPQLVLAQTLAVLALRCDRGPDGFARAR